MTVESLRETLARLQVAAATAPRGVDDDELCPRCRAYEVLGHTCCTCRDAGRVRAAVKVGDSGFGRSAPCPDCAGGPAASRMTPDEWARRARIPERFRACRLETWDRRRYSGAGAPRDAVGGWCSTWPPAKPALVLRGNPGNGKSHLAYGALWELYQRHGVPGLAWNCTELLARYRATMDDDTAIESERDIDDQLARTPVLVLDDYGAQKGTEWTAAKLYQVINRRYEAGLPLVLTTNADLSGDRTVSRLLDRASSVVVVFDGRDARAAA